MNKSYLTDKMMISKEEQESESGESKLKVIEKEE